MEKGRRCGLSRGKRNRASNYDRLRTDLVKELGELKIKAKNIHDFREELERLQTTDMEWHVKNGENVERINRLEKRLDTPLKE